MTLKMFLIKKKIRQIEVAYKLGVDPGLFNRFLNEWQELPLKYIHKLSEILNIPKDCLVKNEILESEVSSDSK